MKRVLKVILAFAIFAGIGFGGYQVGKNTASGNAGDSASQESNLNSLKKVIKDNYLFDYTDEDLDNGVKKGLFAGLGDPYTNYFTEEEYKQFMESTDGRYAGIGVMIQKDEMGVKVVEVFEKSPAEKAGMKAGDIISKVGDKTFTGDQIEDVSSAIRGKVGTSVDITVERPNKEKTSSETKKFTVKRENVEVTTVKSKIFGEGKTRVGYIQLRQFDSVTRDDFSTALKDLESQGAGGIVLDLRNNPGGLLDVCVNIADTFLDEGVIVSTVDKDGKKVEEKSDKDHDPIPLVVLINENSASASEILAGALKDRGRAEIVGTKSFGKGIVQKTFGFADGSGAKITVSEYFTPNGTKIHKKGVEPTVEVKNDGDDTSIDIDNLGKDKQFVKALEVLLKEMK